MPRPTFFPCNKRNHVVGGMFFTSKHTQPSTIPSRQAHGSAPAMRGQPTTRCHRLYRPKVNINVYVLTCRDPMFLTPALTMIYIALLTTKEIHFPKIKIKIKKPPQKRNGNLLSLLSFEVLVTNQKYSD